MRLLCVNNKCSSSGSCGISISRNNTVSAARYVNFEVSEGNDRCHQFVKLGVRK
jgi:hypothetical protein